MATACGGSRFASDPPCYRQPGLIEAERRKRLGAADTTTRLTLIADLPITTDDETPHRALREVLTLARAEGLATWDAAYLELAMRKGLPLATKDRMLRDAAKRAGIVPIPDQPA